MPFLSSPRMALIKSAFWIALIPGSILFLYLQLSGYAHLGYLGVDSHAYWVAARMPETWYNQPPGYEDAYLYSPAFAQLLSPLGRLSWPVFGGLWALAGVLVLVWLLAPMGWRRGLILAPFFCTDLLLGNVYTFFAGALVLGLGRLPAALSLPLLTKVAPGVVCAWFLVRREWRKAGWAAAATLAIAGVSYLIEPTGWTRWVAFLFTTSTGDRGGAVGVRLVIALAIVIWAARTGRSWLLAPALILACPVLGGYGPQSVLAAIPRLRLVAPLPDAEADMTERSMRLVGAKEATVAGTA